jgi:hypothetical protein
MAAGNFTYFNLAKKKLGDGTFDLDTHTFKAVLCTSSQAIAATFVGTSTDCRYSDLTAELATANGYTAGGATLGSVTWNQSTGTITWDAADTAWTLTGAITFKYLIIYDDTSANDNLLGFVDADTGGGSISPSAGTLNVGWNASGIFTLA